MIATYFPHASILMTGAVLVILSSMKKRDKNMWAHLISLTQEVRENHEFSVQNRERIVRIETMLKIKNKED